MVGGVLVERTIKEVLPALETNYSGVSPRKNNIANNIDDFNFRFNKLSNPCYNPTNVKKKNLLNSKRNTTFKLSLSNNLAIKSSVDYIILVCHSEKSI